MKYLYLLIIAFLICGCAKENLMFDKITYKTTSCFGTYPTYYLEINSDKTFKLFAEQIYKDDFSIYGYELDSSKIGYFKGKLDDVTFKNLNQKIQKISNPKYKYYRDGMITDTPTITLVVQRGGDKTCYQTRNPTDDFQIHVIDFFNKICSGKVEKGEKFMTDYKFDCF